MEPRIFAYTHSSEIECLAYDRYRIRINEHRMESGKDVKTPHSFVYGESEPEVWEIARRKVRELEKTIPRQQLSRE